MADESDQSKDINALPLRDQVAHWQAEVDRLKGVMEANAGEIATIEQRQGEMHFGQDIYVTTHAVNSDPAVQERFRELFIRPNHELGEAMRNLENCQRRLQIEDQKAERERAYKAKVSLRRRLAQVLSSSAAVTMDIQATGNTIPHKPEGTTIDRSAESFFDISELWREPQFKAIITYVRKLAALLETDNLIWLKTRYTDKNGFLENMAILERKAADPALTHLFPSTEESSEEAQE